MAELTPLDVLEEKALRDQATIDVVSTVATTMEMALAGHDIAPWIAENTEHWTRDHGRQAVLIIGMLASGAELGPEDIAAMGKLLLSE